eukprot:COSAG05_NODE_1682_length_4285_cov_33.861682_3_plen_142_part_00
MSVQLNAAQASLSKLTQEMEYLKSSTSLVSNELADTKAANAILQVWARLLVLCSLSSSLCLVESRTHLEREGTCVVLLIWRRRSWTASRPSTSSLPVLPATAPFRSFRPRTPLSSQTSRCVQIPICLFNTKLDADKQTMTR